MVLEEQIHAADRGNTIAPDTISVEAITARERLKSRMLRAWILAGLFFMALPGTLLGFSNLLAISTHHGLGALSPAWIQGHAHAQVYGWIGSFVLGIGFYSQPSHGKSVLRVPLSCFILWVTGVATRWYANIYSWHWQVLVPLSATFELIAILLFVSAASGHKLPESVRGTGAKPKREPMELWMVSVLISTAGLAALVLFNFVECLRLAATAVSPARPHGLDQRYLVLLGWGFLAPVVWGFSARWLPAFLGMAKPRQRPFALALILDLCGVLAGVAGWVMGAAVLLVLSAGTVTFALRIFELPIGKAKTQGVHPSFPFFARIPYLWLVIAAGMGVWAAFADHQGGIWGGSRHALTVGFAASMVFAIGPRILPHFGGIYRVFSTRLMFACLLLLQTGCFLRVTSEPLAYEGLASFAWKVLPVSGMLELGGVLLFAANMVLTFAFGQSAFAADRPVEAAAAA